MNIIDWNLRSIWKYIKLVAFRIKEKASVNRTSDMGPGSHDEATALESRVSSLEDRVGAIEHVVKQLADDA